MGKKKSTHELVMGCLRMLSAIIPSFVFFKSFNSHFCGLLFLFFTLSSFSISASVSLAMCLSVSASVGLIVTTPTL